MFLQCAVSKSIIFLVLPKSISIPNAIYIAYTFKGCKNDHVLKICYCSKVKSRSILIKHIKVQQG